ncbi:MAG: hypothetical protein OXE76_13370, partial [Alphaproteobacteria bacterium]|nr:hypothetical protein [Alphaproteobacteria bacterium]
APATPIPIDHLLFNLGNSRLAHKLSPLQMTPGVVRHLPFERFGSDMGASRINGQKLWKPGYMTRLGLRKTWIMSTVRGQSKRAGVDYLAGPVSNQAVAGAG